MANRFKIHAVSFLNWALSDDCPYVWYEGFWYERTKEPKAITTAELYEIWTKEKP